MLHLRGQRSNLYSNVAVASTLSEEKTETVGTPSSMYNSGSMLSAAHSCRNILGQKRRMHAKEQVRRQSAACILQCLFRKYCATWKKATIMVSAKSVIKVQSLVRMLCAQHYVGGNQITSQNFEENSVGKSTRVQRNEKIQTCWRRHHSVFMYSLILGAVACIQRIFRGYASRRSSLVKAVSSHAAAVAIGKATRNILIKIYLQVR